MPAFTAVRYKEKPVVDLYNRTFEKHGIKMKSYVAAQKKLLVLIYHIWKKNEEYNPDYKEKINQHHENISSILGNVTAKKNSPKQVEAIPDKQIIFKDEVLSIS
jgi:hypothetical protein